MDQDRLCALLGQVVTDLGAAVAVRLVLLGDGLGIFDRLAEGAATATGLAERSGLSDRYVQEWLLAMAASGCVTHLGEGGLEVSAEQRELFCQPDSPAYVVGGVQATTAPTRALDRLTEAFRSGEGSAGTSTTRTCSPARSASSALATSTS